MCEGINRKDMKLRVAFNDDPTGMSKDITEEIVIPKDVCLFCLHDSRQNINRLAKEVKTALEYKGYDFTEAFHLLKVYSVG